MATIIKKGTSDSCFRLKNNKVITLKASFGAGDILNVIPDEDYEELMNEYGAFISKRVITDKHPLGCFIISENKKKAKDQSKEVGEVKDNSAPINLDELNLEAPKKRGRKAK